MNLKEIRILKNTIWLALAEFFNKIFRFLIFVLAARKLGTEDFGRFSFALSFVSLFVIFFDFGLVEITTRELAKDREREKDFPAIFTLKLILGLFTFLLVSFLSLFLIKEKTVKRIVPILALYFFFEWFLPILFAFFRAREKMEYEFVFKSLFSLSLFLSSSFVLFFLPSLENFSLSLLFSSFIVSLFSFLFFHRKIFPLSFSFDKKIFFSFLSMAWPLALVSAYTSIYTQADSALMGFFGQISQVGFYSAAQRIIQGVMIVMSLISLSFFPALSRTFKESKEEFQKIWKNLQKIMIVLAFPLVFGGFLLAPKIIFSFYGPHFSPAILSFKILIFMLGIIFLYNPFRWALICANQQKRLFFAFLIGALFSLIANLIFIPKYSLYGASFVAVFTHFCIFLFVLYFSLKFTPIKPFDFETFFVLFSSLISSIFMYLILKSFFVKFNLIFVVFLGALFYFSFLFIFFKIKNLWRKSQI